MLVLVTGAAGQLGLSLNHLVDQNKSNHQFIFATRELLDLSDFKFIRNFIKKNQFDVIINCAAYTHVEKAESEKDKADLVNHLSVNNLAEIANDSGIKLIHISTDYVFDGSKNETMMKLIILPHLMFMVRLSSMEKLQSYLKWN